MPRRKWTDEDRQFLRDNWQKMTNKELGEHFGMPASAVSQQLKKLGLTRRRDGSIFESSAWHIRGTESPKAP